jgi:hypothetical protein
MPQLCPQLKQNLETINSLKSELNLELLKIEKMFKDSKKGNPSTSLRTERKDLMNKIKSLKIGIDLEIEKIEKELPSEKIEIGKEFYLKFKYRKLEEMIKAGKFDQVDNYITSTNFPDPREKQLLNQTVKLKAKIFSFKNERRERYISSEHILAELDKAGFRPATLAELLALAEIDLELQRQFFIVSLGSLSPDSLNVAYLKIGGSTRELSPSHFGGGWIDDCSFLAIRKTR